MKFKPETIFFIGIIVVVLGALGGLFLLSNKPAKVVDTNSLVRENNYFLGPKGAKVVLIEFGDFQCPACKATEGALRQVREEYKDKIKFVFKHFPLPSHNHAMITARAAEAAGVQGKFWEMHDLIYDNQENWSVQANSKDLLIGYAKKLGLDVEKFKKDLESDKINEIINTDKSDGLDVEVSATPTFFLNGEKIVGGLSFSEFKKKIEQMLAKE